MGGMNRARMRNSSVRYASELMAKGAFQLASAVVVTAAMVSAQQAPPASPLPQFRSSVDTVHLDVSVLDRHRRPVRGLKPADFTVLEDGKPQQVAVFQAVDIPDPEPPAAAWTREIAPDVATNEGIQDRRLFLILMDDMTIQGDVKALATAREIGREVIARLGPSDLAAVIFTRDNRHAQDYTNDVARLRAAVDRFSAGFRDLGLFDADARAAIGGQDDYFYMSSVNVLESAVEHLTALPDRRKAIVYIGQGQPVNLDFVAPQAAGLPVGGGASGQMQGLLAERIRSQMQRIITKANRANVNVYTMDACGLRTYGLQQFPPPTCVPGWEVHYLHAVAAGTGGRAFVNSNDFGPGVAAMFAENASYYLLGYRSSSASDGRLHRLEVRVNRPDVDVRTRNGYQAVKPADARKRAAQLAASPLGAALAGILPKSDLPLQMSAVPIPQPGRKESAVAVIVGVRQPIRESAGRVTERVDLQVRAFDVSGKPFGARALRADVAIRAGATGLAEYEVLSRIDLAPGRYQLRIAGHVGSLATSGSLYADVDVPDIGKAPLTMSAMLFTTSPALISAPADALKSVVPMVPTARRTFAGSDRVGAFARLYRKPARASEAGVPIRVQIVDAGGLTVFDRSQDFAPERFTAQQTADIMFDVPVAQLDAGEYLLTFETRHSGGTIRRDARFRVVR